jgi:hypothetical protein
LKKIEKGKRNRNRDEKKKKNKHEQWKKDYIIQLIRDVEERQGLRDREDRDKDRDGFVVV